MLMSLIILGITGKYVMGKTLAGLQSSCNTFQSNVSICMGLPLKERVTQPLGHYVELRCHIWSTKNMAGQNIFIWEHNGEVLALQGELFIHSRSRQRYRLREWQNVTFGASLLLIEFLEKSDAGEFSCLVSAIPSAKKIIQLDVEDDFVVEEDRWNKRKVLLKVSPRPVKEFYPFNLSCGLEINRKESFFYSLDWFHNGQLLYTQPLKRLTLLKRITEIPADNVSTTTKLRTVLSEAILHFQRANLLLNGIYQCRAHAVNEFGEVVGSVVGKANMRLTVRQTRFRHLHYLANQQNPSRYPFEYESDTPASTSETRFRDVSQVDSNRPDVSNRHSDSKNAVQNDAAALNSQSKVWPPPYEAPSLPGASNINVNNKFVLKQNSSALSLLSSWDVLLYVSTTLVSPHLFDTWHSRLYLRTFLS